MKKIALLIALSCVYLMAKSPSNPFFSMDNKHLSEPPALPQIYGIDLPHEVEYFPSPAPKETFNAFLPSMPLLMEICAITGRTIYAYPNTDSLMQGCYRGDDGLSLFLLQPYQYWSALYPLKDVPLMPQPPLENTKPIIIANYKQGNMTITSIEIGDADSMPTLIRINGNAFQNNYAVISAFYGLVSNQADVAYLREKPQVYLIANTHR